MSLEPMWMYNLEAVDLMVVIPILCEIIYLGAVDLKVVTFPKEY